MYRAARLLTIASLLSAGLLLAGCDQLGIDTPAKVAERRAAEGRAIGAACRHAARAIEDCYALNRKSDKAAVFAGWREMNDYMRENAIEPVAPLLTTPSVAGSDEPVKGSSRSDPDERPARKPS